MEPPMTPPISAPATAEPALRPVAAPINAPAVAPVTTPAPVLGPGSPAQPASISAIRLAPVSRMAIVRIFVPGPLKASASKSIDSLPTNGAKGGLFGCRQHEFRAQPA